MSMSTAPSSTGDDCDRNRGELFTAQNSHFDVTKVITAIFSLCMTQHCSEGKEELFETNLTYLPTHQVSNMSSGVVRRPRSILGLHIWCACASPACGREEGRGWRCSEDTPEEEGWAAGCECFGRFALELQSSDKGHERHVLPVVESSGGLKHWVESPAGWSCREGEGCKVGRDLWGSWQRGAGKCMTTMYSWVHPVWALSQRTYRPDAVPRLSCRGSQWEPGQGCWTEPAEEEGRRRGGSKTRPHWVSCKGRVSCRSAGGFLESSSPPLQTQTQRKYCVDLLFLSFLKLMNSETWKSSSCDFLHYLF